MNNIRKINEYSWSSIRSVLNEVFEHDGSSKSREYWHYTSSKGVLAIFSDYIEKSYKEPYVKKCSFYASNIRFMNDEQEYKEGLEAYNREATNYINTNDSVEAFPTDIKISDNIYLISFCGNGDLLSQWEWYGKESGIAIRFNLPDIEYKTYSYVDKDGKEVYSYPDSQTKPLKVRYTSDDQKDLYIFLKSNSLIRNSKAEELVQSVFVPLCKHEGFKAEDESRLVFYDTELSSSKELYPRFNIVYNSSDPAMIKPALKVEFSLKTDKSDIKNIIKEIVVGPGNNQELLFNLLIHIFDRHNYSYQISPNKTDRINLQDFEKSKEIGMRYVYCPDRNVRVAYRCENGIIVMKSILPFRG